MDMGIDKIKIVVGSIKGGVGKSTLAFNLAAYLVNKGMDVTLLDSDPQRSLSKNIGIRNDQEIKPIIHCVEQLGRNTETITELARRYQVVIVDCAGHDSLELRSALIVADILISPCCPSQPDLAALDLLAENIRNASVFNQNLKNFLVLNRTPTNPHSVEAKEAKEYAEELQVFTLLETRIPDRKIYRDSSKTGLGVNEMNQLSLSTSERKAFQSASSEIEQLWNEIEEHYVAAKC